MKPPLKIQTIPVMFFFLLICDGITVNAENKIRVGKPAPIKMQQKESRVFCDLQVTRIKHISKRRDNRDMVNLLIFVRNAGAEKSPVSFLKIKSNGKDQAMIRVPPLSPNQTKRIKSRIKGIKQGDIRITAIINPEKKFAERDYKNNFLNKKIKLNKTSAKPRRMQSPKPLPPNTGDSPHPKLILKEMQLAVQYSIEITDFITGPTSQNGWKWSARLRNTGSNQVPGYRLKLKAIQIPGTVAAGGFCMAPSIPKGALSKRMTMTHWTKADDADDLRLEVWDTEMNTRIASQIIPFPNSMDAPLAAASIKNVSRQWHQQGKVRIHVSGRKEITPAISSNRLRLHVSMHLHSTGDTVGVANLYQASEVNGPVGHEFYFQPVEVQYGSGENRIHLKLWDQWSDRVIDEESFVAHPYQGVQ